MTVTIDNAVLGSAFSGRTVASKIAEIVSVKDYGAVGNGSNNDTTAVQAAMTACAGTWKTLLIPHGNYSCAALDASNVRRIICEGVIKSTIAVSEIGVIVGSTTPGGMQTGNVEIRIVHNSASNAGLTGTIGIAVRGADGCVFRLDSSYFEVGIDLQPPTGAPASYISYCNFNQCQTYGTLIGLRLNPSGAGTFINENVFTNLTLKRLGNSLAGTQIAILLQGITPNNNLFLKPALENWAVPIKIVAGLANKFIQPRLETAGAIILGDGTTGGGAVSRNTFEVQYTQAGSLPSWTMTGWAPNFFGGPDGVQWREVADITYDDWINNGTTYYHRKLHNTSAGKSFTSVVLTAATKSFQLAGAERGIVYVPVVLGDTFYVDVGWTGTPTGSNAAYTVQARDSTLAVLATLTAGDIPYIGTTVDSNFNNATSITSVAKSVSVSNYALGRYVVSCRAETAFFSFEINSQNDNTHFRIFRMRSVNAAVSPHRPNWPQTKYLTDFTTAPDFPGQVGLQGTSGETRIAKSATAWTTEPLTSTTAALAAIANAINTTDKYAGKTVFNTTTSRLCTATGSTAGSTWQPSDGTTVHTPA